MFNKKHLSLRTRDEVGSSEGIKFIEPDYKRVGWKNNLYLNLIIGFRFFIVLLFLFLSVRIFFMDGGYLDLSAKKSKVKELRQEYQEIVSDNKSLTKEINKIKKSSSYQKFLAREHLGVIAKDELMILFKEKKSTLKNPSDPQS